MNAAPATQVTRTTTRKTTKQRATAGLEAIGACWAVNSEKCILPGDDYDSKPTYHVHPDSSEPRQNAILHLETLGEVLSYVKAVKECMRRNPTDSRKPIEWTVEYQGNREWAAVPA